MRKLTSLAQSQAPRVHGRPASRARRRRARRQQHCGCGACESHRTRCADLHRAHASLQPHRAAASACRLSLSPARISPCGCAAGTRPLLSVLSVASIAPIRRRSRPSADRSRRAPCSSTPSKRRVVMTEEPEQLRFLVPTTSDVAIATASSTAINEGDWTLLPRSIVPLVEKFAGIKIPKDEDDDEDDENDKDDDNDRGRGTKDGASEDDDDDDD
jgi:hypothetical protein